jgi:hypothetical protein
MQNEQRDVYGFPLEGLLAHQRADRATCAAYEARRKSKWQVFVDRQELPTGAGLKRYCRKVGTALQLLKLPVAVVAHCMLWTASSCWSGHTSGKAALRLVV